MTTKLPISLLANGLANTAFQVNVSNRIDEVIIPAGGVDTGRLQYATIDNFTVGGGAIFNQQTGETVYLPTLTKSMTALFTPGNNNGCMDGATKVANSSYHVFVIRNNITFAGDIFCSLSLTPTIPAGWTLIKRLGSIHTLTNGQIYPFRQHGKRFILDVDRAGSLRPMWSFSSKSSSFNSEFAVTLRSVPDGVPKTMSIHTQTFASWGRCRTAYFRLPSALGYSASGQGLFSGMHDPIISGGAGITSSCAGTFDFYSPNTNAATIGLLYNWSGNGRPSVVTTVFVSSYIDHSI